MDYGKIYEIVCNISGERYIGSTNIKDIRQRISKHKYQKCSSKQILDRNDYKVNILENYVCDTRKELLQKEQCYIDNTENINKQDAVCKLTPSEKTKEWQKNNPKKNKVHRKNYYERNKNKINEKVICEICGCENTKSHLKRHQKTKKCMKHFK